VWRVLATHSIRQFPLHFPSRASPCAITFQLDSTTQWKCAGIDWNDLVQDSDKWRALVKAVMNLRVPQNAANFLASWETVSFSERTLFLQFELYKGAPVHAMGTEALLQAFFSLADGLWVVSRHGRFDTRKTKQPSVPT